MIKNKIFSGLSFEDKIKAIESNQVNLNQALKWSAINGHKKLVKSLIKKGATNIEEAFNEAKFHRHQNIVDYLNGKFKPKKQILKLSIILLSLFICVFFIFFSISHFSNKRKSILPIEKFEISSITILKTNGEKIVIENYEK
jgi:hypothetical protein